MSEDTDLKLTTKTLFASQRLGVLGTHDAGQPYLSLVAFVAAPDLRHLFFATNRATRKYANLTADPRVAMQVDNRTNQDSDFHQAMSTTAVGQAKEVSGGEKAGWEGLFLTQHPYLKEFVQSPTCALLKMTVDTYQVVNRFQDVRQWHLTPGPAQ